MLQEILAAKERIERKTMVEFAKGSKFIFEILVVFCGYSFG